MGDGNRESDWANTVDETKARGDATGTKEKRRQDKLRVTSKSDKSGQLLLLAWARCEQEVTNFPSSPWK